MTAEPVNDMDETTVGAYEAKTHLPRLLRLVAEEGKTITITKHGEAVAELRPPSKQIYQGGDIDRDSILRRMDALLERQRKWQEENNIPRTTIEEIIEWKKEGRR